MAGPAARRRGRWEPSQIEAARLEQVRLDAEEVCIDAHLQSGQYREVLAEAQALVARQPLRERRWALLALAQYQAGRQGEALRTLRQARSVLAAELGIDPGPELVALEQAILRQDPELIADGVPGVASPLCPYRGLVPFDVDDADGFFGRDLATGECLRRLAVNGVLVVVGPSGCGKSSLVRAGVAAALQRDGRRVTVVTPGAHPLDAFTGLPVNGDAVLVVDQCEEAVTLCTDPAEQTRFFAALAEHADRSPSLSPLRADRLADVVRPARGSPGWSSAACTSSARWTRRSCGRRSRAPLVRPGCCSNRGWSTFWSARSRANRALCRCCHTPSARPGSGAKAAR